jgi:hypothetical protein
VGSVTLAIMLLFVESSPSQIIITITRQVLSCASNGHIDISGDERSLALRGSVAASSTQNERFDCALL